MRFYRHIQFQNFTSRELCEFLVERLHADVQHFLTLINASISQHGVDFELIDDTDLYISCFTKLKDRCEQLMRIESQLVMPMYNKQLDDCKELSLNAQSAVYMDELINSIQFEMHQIKTILHQLCVAPKLTVREKIILNDLCQLDAILCDWLQIKTTYLHVALIA